MTNEQVRQVLTNKFDKLSATLSDMKSKAREMKHEVRAKWESQLAELERQHRAARARLTEFSSDSAEAWSTFRTGMEATWNSLKKTCEEAAEKLQ